jgi:RNA polymerase sigma factor (sigma-70 family)
MATPTLGTFLHRLKTAMATETLASRSDQELIEEFRAGRDEVIFRAIMERHGQMVFHVCRRVLASTTDVEDAFQSTFLTLIRRGHTVRRHASLASWLHGVAWRTALKLRTQSDRRRRREGKSAESKPTVVSDNTSWGELRRILDEELTHLPETVRTPLVLCYLEGRTQDEAASQLDISKSTLRRHLDRGREMLGRRLVRRGVTLGSVLAARLVSDCAQGAGVPRALLVRTTESANHIVANGAAPATVVTARVAALSDGVIKSMYYAKYKTVVATLAFCLAIGIGLHQFSPRPVSAQDRSPQVKTPPATAPDIEPINPELVFEEEIQKKLKLSPNQIRQLNEAREKGTASASDSQKKLNEIDQKLEKLQKEIEKLNEERSKAYQVIHKSQSEQVKAKISQVLSRDAVRELREITLQRMQLSDVLLDSRIRARLDLNDEQVKKIQEIKEKCGDAVWVTSNLRAYDRFAFVDVDARVTNTATGAFLYGLVSDSGNSASRAELIKVLTPRQIESLEKLGLKFEKGK